MIWLILLLVIPYAATLIFHLAFGNSLLESAGMAFIGAHTGFCFAQLHIYISKKIRQKKATIAFEKFHETGEKKYADEYHRLSR